MQALILAPFDQDVLNKLGSLMGVIYRSWAESGSLLEPEQFLDYIHKDDVQIIVMEADFIFEEVLSETDKLKLIGVCRGSVNNVDLDMATRQGVLVINTPGRNSSAVAELTVGLALSLARHIPQADNLVKTGGWTDPVGPYIHLRGTELGGKIAGIVGFGAIGLEVARRLRAFDMEVMVYDPFVTASRIQAAGAKPAELDCLLAQADVVSFHCTAGEATQGLIDAKRVGLLKPTAYLINTASWEVIDEPALIEALANHRICGAAFDIFSSHPLHTQSPLLKLDNIILTPHIGGSTDTTITRYSRMIYQDIARFLDGQRPINLINPEAWSKYAR
jgi:D-3-phosphoglycerate dehydrogenase / 2-oxoglutarate reductase